MNVRNEVIYGILTPNIFAIFNKSHYLQLLYPAKGKQNTFAFEVKRL